jgi:hypothetical protein
MRNDREPSKRASALFPAREDRERWDDFLTRELARADERVGAGSVTPTLDLGAFRSELSEFDFQAPRGHRREDKCRNDLLIEPVRRVAADRDRIARRTRALIVK